MVYHSNNSNLIEAYKSDQDKPGGVNLLEVQLHKYGKFAHPAFHNSLIKISFTDATGSYINDDLAFFPFNSVGYEESKTLKYDKNGFLSSISNNSNKTEFFYNN